jgi:hypothetical protein
LSQVKAKPPESPFWKGIMKVKQEFFERGSFTIKNGEYIRFWDDAWLNDTPLAHQYPFLYNIIQRKQLSVPNAMKHVPLNIGFRHALVGNRADFWVHFVQSLMGVQLFSQPDVFVWELTKSGSFTIKSPWILIIWMTIQNSFQNIYGKWSFH